MNFNAKVVAVTGAASGIGKAVATYLAERGATIAAIDLAESELPAGAGHLAIRADLTNPEEARAALRAVTREDAQAILRQLTLSVSYLLTREEVGANA